MKGGSESPTLRSPTSPRFLLTSHLLHCTLSSSHFLLDLLTLSSPPTPHSLIPPLSSTPSFSLHNRKDLFLSLYTSTHLYLITNLPTHQFSSWRGSSLKRQRRTRTMPVAQTPVAIKANRAAAAISPNRHILTNPINLQSTRAKARYSSSSIRAVFCPLHPSLPINLMLMVHGPRAWPCPPTHSRDLLTLPRMSPPGPTFSFTAVSSRDQLRRISM